MSAVIRHVLRFACLMAVFVAFFVLAGLAGIWLAVGMWALLGLFVLR